MKQKSLVMEFLMSNVMAGVERMRRCSELPGLGSGHSICDSGSGLRVRARGHEKGISARQEGAPGS